jgi:hypothetical protein
MKKKGKIVTPGSENSEGYSKKSVNRKEEISLQSKRYVNLLLAAEKEKKNKTLLKNNGNAPSKDRKRQNNMESPSLADQNNREFDTKSKEKELPERIISEVDHELEEESDLENNIDDLNNLPTVDHKGFTINTELNSHVTNKDSLSKSNIIKVLRVLAEPECSFSMELTIHLHENTTDIVEISNEISLTSCKLVPTSFVPNSNFVQSGKLHVKGVITKNITYSLSNELQNKKLEIPFLFNTDIAFPKNRQPNLALTNKQSFKFSNSEENSSSNEKLLRTKVVYNDPLQFELVSAMFHELNVTPKLSGDNNTFQTYESSISTDVTIRVMQRQTVKSDGVLFSE